MLLAAGVAVCADRAAGAAAEASASGRAPRVRGVIPKPLAVARSGARSCSSRPRGSSSRSSGAEARASRELPRRTPPAGDRLPPARRRRARRRAGGQHRARARRQATARSATRATACASTRERRHADRATGRPGSSTACRRCASSCPPRSRARRPAARAVAARAGRSHDRPRFAWRGAMLDVARHFFGVAEVKRFIDLMALYKLNRLHLHLTDDQGWRIAIRSWPRLTTLRRAAPRSAAGRAGTTRSASTPRIVAYAAARFVDVVPEIDMPGHVNAALASYAEAQLRRRRAAALHRHRGRLQLALHRQGADVSLRGRRDPRDRRSDARAVRPHRRRRGALRRRPRTTCAFMRARRADRPLPRQADDRLGGDRARPSCTAHLGRPALARPCARPPGGRAGREARHVAGAEGVPRHEVHAGLAARADVGGHDQRAGRLHVGSRDAGARRRASATSSASRRRSGSETAATRADVDFLAFPRLLGHAEIAWSPAAGRAWRRYRWRLARARRRACARSASLLRVARGALALSGLRRAR